MFFLWIMTENGIKHLCQSPHFCIDTVFYGFGSALAVMEKMGRRTWHRSLNPNLYEDSLIVKRFQLLIFWNQEFSDADIRKNYDFCSESLIFSSLTFSVIRQFSVWKFLNGLKKRNQNCRKICP